jgi:hypothetical protein
VSWFKRSPIQTLNGLVHMLADPKAKRDRHAYWRVLGHGKHWALVLVTHGKPGEPQNPPYEPYRKTTDRELHVIRRHRKDDHA